MENNLNISNFKPALPLKVLKIFIHFPNLY